MKRKRLLRKILKIIFWLSFMPYLFLIGYSLYFALFGYDSYTWIMHQYIETLYGWDAFREVFIWTAFGLCFLPVLPICFFYQVAFGIIHNRFKL